MRERGKKRSGAALIEFAFCMPLFFAITMGTIEVCRLLYLKQSIKIAAYECARLGIIPGMPPEGLQAQCDAILVPRGIKGYVFNFSPSNLGSLKYGDILTTTIEVPLDQNDLMGSWFYRQRNIVSTVAIMAEY